ncbi:hypothetical protein [Streptomyces himalayensis]|uniref:Uncharacterized protein n=1 Tax=Streptomyces himalayensis subsp. himalayensis TaxID=2756131 RepID=A0A7W0ID85_9ACTN|nr:hypothetical protein [Streptomyces himalayensis]MBA2951453.1 hypothetical protein [Streptomyces himalayensis subsp. himalayensis]
MASEDSSSDCHPGRDGEHCPEHDPCCYCEKPNPGPECQHPDNDPCDRCLMPKSYYIPCGCGHVQGEHRTFMEGGCTNCRCKSFALPPAEPPLTPEEEEELPEDGEDTAQYHVVDGTKYLCHEGDHYCPKPPQPERRPPLAVDYSAGGHPYQVLVPGDATVWAVDGALVIRHHGFPVLGITATTPFRQEARNG